MGKFGLLALGSLFVVSSAYAQVHRTLPKGVRLLAYRNVNTTKIDATYNQAQAVTPLSYNINANAATLESAGTAAKLYFEQLQAISPEAYDQLTFGEFNISAVAQVQVHGFGGGYGITEKLTVYGILPYYNANVNMKYKQIRGSNSQEIADQVQLAGQGDIDSTLGNITSSIPSATGNVVQSVLVNTYGYQEIGNWQGSGYGDFELGAMYRLIDRGTWGFAVSSGLVAPTGRQDDPDILQDIAFGDGQWDAFVEGAYGYVLNDSLMFGTTLRYTYQAPTEKTLRVPTSRGSTISDTKGDFVVKYGDRLDAVLSSTYTINDWFSLTPAYEVNYQMPSDYSSAYGPADGYLEYNSDRIGHVGRMSASISSIQPFLKKKFALPAQINFNVQQTLAGKNVPKMGRFEVELRMLF
jgi:hypothetical protein